MSLDIKGNTHSCVIDGTLTSVAGRLVKIIAWFDNEYGYTSRMIDWLYYWNELNDMTISRPRRLASIDVFRAITMMLMIFVNDLDLDEKVPRWLEHAAEGEDRLGLADTVFPAFLFYRGAVHCFCHSKLGIQRHVEKVKCSGSFSAGRLLCW